MLIKFVQRLKEKELYPTNMMVAATGDVRYLISFKYETLQDKR